MESVVPINFKTTHAPDLYGLAYYRFLIPTGATLLTVERLSQVQLVPQVFFPGITEPGADGVGIVGTIPPDHSRKKTPGCLGRGKVPRGVVHAAKRSRTSAKEIGNLYYKYPQRLCQLLNFEFRVAVFVHMIVLPANP